MVQKSQGVRVPSQCQEKKKVLMASIFDIYTSRRQMLGGLSGEDAVMLNMSTLEDVKNFQKSLPAPKQPPYLHLYAVYYSTTSVFLWVGICKKAL
jgi:hypothetical protein